MVTNLIPGCSQTLFKYLCQDLKQYIKILVQKKALKRLRKKNIFYNFFPLSSLP